MLIGNLKETFLSLQLHRKTRGKTNPLGAHEKILCTRNEAHNGLMVAGGA
jgi:hypothetical protein